MAIPNVQREDTSQILFRLLGRSKHTRQMSMRSVGNANPLGTESHVVVSLLSHPVAMVEYPAQHAEIIEY